MRTTSRKEEYFKAQQNLGKHAEIPRARNSRTQGRLFTDRRRENEIDVCDNVYVHASMLRGNFMVIKSSSRCRVRLGYTNKTQYP